MLSQGLSSIIGTCLYAAAWKTYSGRKVLNMFSILSALVIDVTTVAHGTDGKSCAIILRMSCCGVSAESISIRDDGLNDAT